VYYDLDPSTGVITRVRIARGALAGDLEIGEHAETARAMLRYSGLSGRVRVLWEQLLRLLGSEAPAVGTRAWEAKLELAKLPKIIQNRVAQLANPKLTETQRADLIDEIAGYEDQVDEHARLIADMNLDPSAGGRKYVAATGTRRRRSGGGGRTRTTPGATTAAGTPPATAPPPVPLPPRGAPGTIVGVSDPRTAAMGGITVMRQTTNAMNEVETTIEGRLLPGMNRPTAPNYNRDAVWASLKAAHPELRLGDWQAAHLWGPGFGDEAAAGMMLAPEFVNQEVQNRNLEDFVRELRDIAGQQGWEVWIKATARSHPRDFAGGMGDSLMQSVTYDVSVANPGGERVPFAQMSFSVDPPPGGRVSAPKVTWFRRPSQ
jgi:hypothetical protein